MKKFRVNQLMVLVFFAFVGVSCSKDDEVTVDPRDQAVGSYIGSTEFKTTEGTDEVPTGITITKDLNNNTTLIITDEDGFQFKADKVTALSNGVVFDIPQQSFTEQGETVFMEGLFSATVEGSKYHGFYNSSNKELFFGITYEFENSEYSMFNSEVRTTAIRME